MQMNSEDLKYITSKHIEDVRYRVMLSIFLFFLGYLWFFERNTYTLLNLNISSQVKGLKIDILFVLFDL